MKTVLDATVFFSDAPAGGDVFTTPSVVAELLDLRSKGRYEALLATGLAVQEPRDSFRHAVREAARATGDEGVISGTDTDVLALALELSGAVMTDDFAIQNIAGKLGIPVVPVMQRRARQIRWKFRCTGCGLRAEAAGECPVCGSQIKRKLK